MLGTAALVALATTGIATVVLAGIQSLIFEDMDWDRSTIAFAVTGGTWAAGLVTPVVGRLADRYGPRKLMPVTAIFVALCFFGLSGIKTVWQFYVAFIAARVIGGPFLVSLVPRTAAVNFFRRKRNLALALTSMFNPVGSAINIQVISLIAQAASWRVAYRFLGVFLLILVVPLFLIMRRRPEDIGLLPDGDRAPLAGEAGPRDSPGRRGSTSTQAEEFDWRPSEAARTSTFWLIVAAELVIILGGGALVFQVVPYLADSGVSFPLAAGALSLSALLGAVLNPGWGYLADRFSPRRVAMAKLVVSIAVTSLFLLTHPPERAFVLVILWGTASGGQGVLGQMMIAQYFGRSSFGSITGLMGPFQTGVLGLGPAFGALMFDLTGGYTTIFLSALVGYSLSILFFYSVRAPRQPPRAMAEGRTAQD